MRTIGTFLLALLVTNCALGVSAMAEEQSVQPGNSQEIVLLQEADLKKHVDHQELPRVIVAPDKKSFVLESANQKFIPWGFNYDHNAQGRLIEDYWDGEWSVIEKHFAQMKALGANVVRIHLQLGKFMESQHRLNAKSLARLDDLLALANRIGLYLDLTGLGCYHKQDVPAWYDELGESDRWEVQARFWQAVAERGRQSPAVFCYDLMNEPVVADGKRNKGEWLGSSFAGKHFVQFINLDQQDRPRPTIAREWVNRLVAAVREKDDRHLITVGLVDWSLDRPGLTSGFVPSQVAEKLDFLSVHLYPKQGKVSETLDTLTGFAGDKPVIIEETFPLACTPAELESFIDQSQQHACGWIGFYWGQTAEELRREKTIAASLTVGWLELFERKGKKLGVR